MITASRIEFRLTVRASQRLLTCLVLSKRHCSVTISTQDNFLFSIGMIAEYFMACRFLMTLIAWVECLTAFKFQCDDVELRVPMLTTCVIVDKFSFQQDFCHIAIL